MARGSVVVVGGTSGIGLGIATAYASRGRDVVITGRTEERCTDAARGIAGPGEVGSRVFDLAQPQTIATALEGLGEIGRASCRERVFAVV